MNFRTLHETVLDAVDSARPLAEVLDGQAEAVAASMAHVDGLRRRPPRRPEPAHDVGPLHELYALSRTSDLLLELGCPDGEPERQLGETGGRRTADDVLHLHARFFGALGMSPFEHAAGFSPFHHEIFGVVTDDALPDVRLERVLWPGLMFGTLLFARAGVVVRAPSRLIDAHVATSSVLYFAFRRGSRPTQDLSHGWGHNSQWSTSFVRYYADGDGYHLNWDGRMDIGADEPPQDEQGPSELSLDQRREILVHRCFVRAGNPHDSGWPYQDRLSLRRSTWPLAPGDVLKPLSPPFP